jgi:hypothetical protein
MKYLYSFCQPSALFCIALFVFGCVSAMGQPLWNSRKAIGSQVIIQDIKQKNKFYYTPHKLELSKDPEGKPLFKLISMRYTGTQLRGDKAEKRFTNLLQFSVTMPAFTSQELKEMAAMFQLPTSALLVPMPIRNTEAVIVSGVGEGMDDGKLHKRVEVQSETNNGKAVFWSERNFVIPMDNYEAQILWDQYKNGRIAVHLNYAYFADIISINEEELKIMGDSAFVESVKNEVGDFERDTVESLEVVASDALEITIDISKYPDALKQIDINENSIPPAYPSLEVKCFDFSYDIRPDLAYKRIFLEATSVNGQTVQEKIKFAKGTRDITTQFVSFRYAVRMDRPIRYKIIEGGTDGEEVSGNWIQMEQFSNLIDATTQQKINQMTRHCADVEVLTEIFNDENLQQVSVHFLFVASGKSCSQRLDFRKDDAAMVKTKCITHDLAQPVKYFVIMEYVAGKKSRGLLKTLASDGYVLVSK